MQKLSIRFIPKRAAILLGILLLTVLLLGPLSNAANRFVARTLAKNLQEPLTDVSEQILSGGRPDMSVYDRIDSYEIWQRGNTVAYHTGASGIVPASAYYGFYYSADGDIYPCPGMENYDRTETNGCVRYQQPDGDNFCLIEPVAGNYFYFKLGY